jgi:poly(3-hydroxyalkanoate) depolymerase
MSSGRLRLLTMIPNALVRAWTHRSRRGSGHALAASRPGGTQLLTVRGRTLRVAVRPGEPGRTPLLICNGIGASLDLLQPFVDALDPRLPVIRFDLPGIGGSPPPSFPYHLVTLPSLLAGLLDQLGYAQADVLGVSWGGGLAQQFALARPSRVRRLVLVATGTGAIMIPGRPSVLRRMLTPRRHRDPGFARQVAGEIYGGSMRNSPARAAELLRAVAPSRRGYYYQLLAVVGWTSLPLLPLLRRRTLVMAGDDDPLIPAVNARIMHRLIGRSQLHIYRGGHLDLIAEPARLVPVIERFLDPT